MSEKRENPYRAGSVYGAIYEFIRQKQVFTKVEVLAFTLEKFGKELPYDVQVVTSPLEEGKGRGDCRGSTSAKGYLYYVARLARQVKAGVKEPQKMRFRYRTTPLEPRLRATKVDVKSEKKAKVVKATEVAAAAAAKVESPTEAKE